MITTSRGALTAVVAAALVAIPTTAQAADFQRYSTTGWSRVDFNDAANVITVCDRRADDGIGAHVVVQDWPDTISYSASQVAYNGCATLYVPGGFGASISVCDYVHVPGYGRDRQNCRSWIGTT
jgi:asparagine N-glycosylation enzyme membrane subunit Stt3